jgi:hypothetical protein
MKMYGEYQYNSSILNVSITWKYVVSIKLLLLYPQGNFTQYSLYRRLGGLQVRSGSCGGENISQTCWESNPVSSVVQPTA